MPRPPKSELTNTGAYTPELIEFALTAYAVEGNARRAAEIIKAKHGVAPTKETIIKWARDSHNELYLRIREDTASKIKARVATDVEELLRETLEVQARATRRVDRELDGLDARDTPGALRNVATSAAILADKLHQMRGDNTIHVEHTLNADELLRKVGNLLGSGVATIDSTATEIPPESGVAPQPPGQDGSSEGVSAA